MILRNASGEYEPSYFIIRVDSDEPVTTLAERHTSTFVHEYVHFLQDLILPYCIRENAIRLEEFFILIDAARRERSMHLPNRLSEDAMFDVTRRQTAATWGGGTFVPEVARILDIECAEEAFPQYGYSLHRYTLKLQDEKDYHLGARDLLEYIAHKIEDRHFPGGAVLPDLPYRSMDLVLDYHGLARFSTTQRVALAEYCLLNDNPVRRLMVVIEDIHHGAIPEDLLASDEKFIEFLKNFHWIAKGRPPETIARKVERRLQKLREALLTIFPEPAFPAIYHWLDGAIAYSHEKLAGRHLFAQLYAAEEATFRDQISRILADVGIPLLANRNHDIGTSLGDDETTPQFIQLLLAYEFSTYVKRQDPTCPMYDVCDKNNPDIMSEDCMEAPFRRAAEDELCPFGAFVKTHGLDKATWYVNGKILSGLKSGPWS